MDKDEASEAASASVVDVGQEDAEAASAGGEHSDPDEAEIWKVRPASRLLLAIEISRSV